MYYQFPVPEYPPLKESGTYSGCPSERSRGQETRCLGSRLPRRRNTETISSASVLVPTGLWAPPRKTTICISPLPHVSQTSSSTLYEVFYPLQFKHGTNEDHEITKTGSIGSSLPTPPVLFILEYDERVEKGGTNSNPIRLFVSLRSWNHWSLSRFVTEYPRAHGNSKGERPIRDKMEKIIEIPTNYVQTWTRRPWNFTSNDLSTPWVPLERRNKTTV